jgi:hypothetical protein
MRVCHLFICRCFFGNIVVAGSCLKSCYLKLWYMRYNIVAWLTRSNNSFKLPMTLLFLNVIDVLTTSWGLSHGFVEMNPLFSFAVVPLRFLGCGVLFLTSYLLNRLNLKTKILNAVILCVVIVYILVAINNIFWILYFLR